MCLITPCRYIAGRVGGKENRGRGRKKESADNSPSPGRDDPGIKKVLPSGESLGD